MPKEDAKIAAKMERCRAVGPQAVAILRAVVVKYRDDIQCGLTLNGAESAEFIRDVLYPMALGVVARVDK